MIYKSIKHESGFTLIEMVVAVVIFGVISVMAYGGLNRVLDGQEHLQISSKKLKNMQLAFRYIERDINQAINRSIRDQFGDMQDAFIGDEDKAVSFTHAGWRNPAGLTRSNLQRVTYQLSENKLTRYTWGHLDGAIAEDYFSADLIADVKTIKFRYLGNGNLWHQQWPPLNINIEDIPKAIEITIDTEHLGEIKRIFATPS